MTSSYPDLSINATQLQDATFGPTLRGPATQFDFTLLFEKSVLSIVPSSAFLIYGAARAWWLWGARRRARWCWGVGGKQLLYLLLLAAQLTVLAFTATHQQNTTVPTVTLASQTLTIPVTLALSTLSLLEHLHSPRTSDLLNTYLLLSLLLDAVQLRTSYLRPSISPSISIAASVALAVKLALLVAEAQSKIKYLLEDFRDLAPESLSGVYARRLFWWLNGMLRRGWGVGFRGTGELMRIREEFGARGLLDGVEDAGVSRNNKARRTLLRACLIAFKYEIGLLVIPRGILLALNYTQPLLFEAIISHLDAPPETRNKDDGYGLIAATGLLYVCLTIGKTYYQHKTYQLVTKVRGALVSLLYVRTLESAPGSLGNRAPVSLMSVDVDGVTNAVPVYNELWASAVEIGLAGWLLKRQLGVVWVVPFGIALGCSTLAVFLSRKMGPRQAKWNAVTQERVSGTSLVLDSLKSIKMMGFSRYVIEDIRGLRDKEIRSFKVFRRYTVFLNALGNLPFYASPVLTFTAYALATKGDFTAGKAFTSLSLIALLEDSTSTFIGAMPQLAAARGCLARLEEFFLKVTPVVSPSDETPGSGSHNENNEDIRFEVRAKETPRLSFRNATLKPSAKANSFALRNININIQPGNFVAITGSAGCGKTTLIKALLSRLPEMTGDFAVREDHSIGYCAQAPWIPNGTIRDAIIGESKLDEQWYAKVLSACALTEDMKNWEKGDQTEVGNQGSNLSGGQRQRVALARALFSRRKILVLDDVLSGMDAHTTTHICHALFGREGVFRKLGATVVVVTYSAKVLLVMDTVLTLTPEGDINESQPRRLSDLGSEIVPMEETHDEKASDNSVTENDITQSAVAEEVEVIEDIDSARQRGDWELYKHYIKSIGWWRFGILVAAQFANTALDNFPTVWLKQWSSTAQDPGAPNRAAFYLGIYGLVASFGLFFLLFHIWFIFMVLVPASGRNLHTVLLNTVINAKQSFHDKTPTGTTLNRFTQDMQHIDRDVPTAMLRSLTATVECLAAFVLLSISASYTAAFIPVLLIVLYYLQKFYLRTSRQLRLLDIEARAPLFTIFQETVDGLDTIVSFKWSAAWKEKFFDTLDASQKPYYLMFCIQRWLILVLGFVVSAMAIILVTFALQIRGLSSAGAIGVGLIALLKFNDRLHLLIVEWTTLETSLGAIARLKAFSQDTPVEDGAHDGGFDDAWPRQGAIAFRDVSATYRDDLPFVLNNISFAIPSGSTCALVGRTGSGKSTTLSLLMHLMDPISGDILIDGTSLSAVPLQTLRSRIACLPQQPYLLPGSLRRNLDPNQARNDNDLCAALNRVHLWNVFAKTSVTGEMEPKKVLDTVLHASALSPGQTQLLVLARTLLLTPRPKILVLDEVSSSLDDASEALLQDIVREEFAAKGCTVVAVAHRLKGVVGFDRVVVLDAGRVVEVGVPRELVKSGGAFARLCREQGIV